jgi:tRNA threonylcarbamoyladenosine biosynthesis protein TsaE
LGTPIVTVQRTSHSESETLQLAERLGRRLSAGDVVCLEGPLGAGKTCFVRGLATGLGLDPTAVNSPTYVIWQRYEQSQTTLALVHLDAFRLGGPADLDSVGWDELLETPDTVIAVEWPSRITAALPARRIDVVMTHIAANTRRIALDASPEITSTWEGTDD